MSAKRPSPYLGILVSGKPLCHVGTSFPRLFRQRHHAQQCIERSEILEDLPCEIVPVTLTFGTPDATS